MTTFPQLSAHPVVSAKIAKRDAQRSKVAELTAERESSATTANDVQSAARKILDGKAPTVIRSEADIDRDLAIHREALRLAESDVVAAERAASDEIASKAKPEYAAILKRGVKAVSALRHFIADEKEFRESMDDAGIRFLNVIRPVGFGDVTTADCDFFLAEVSEHY